MSPAPADFPERPVRLGFVPEVDGAPIAVAVAEGIFRKHGLDVRISREIGWAGIRGKLAHGELDAAQAVAGIALTMGLGIESPAYDVAVPLVLNLHGCAIVLHQEIGGKAVGRGEGLADFIRMKWREDRPFLLASPHRHSTPHGILHGWMRRNGLHVSKRVEVIHVPGALMPRLLKAGKIDGFCAGEPWVSQTILDGTGWCPARSADVARYHPENLLAAGGSFVRERRPELIRLVGALLEACELCQSAEYRPELIALLSRREFVGAPVEVLRNCLGPVFDSGAGLRDAADGHIFHGGDANRPDTGKANWALSELVSSGSFPKIRGAALGEIYRGDLYSEAVSMKRSGEPPAAAEA